MADTLEKYREGVDRLTGLTDVDEVMKGLSRLLRKTVQSLWTVVYLLDREQRDFAPARSCGLPARYLPLFREMPLVPAKLPLLKTIIRRKQHLLIPDAGGSEMLTPKLRSILCGLSLLAVPMVVRNHVMGVVFVVRSGDYPPFSPEEIAVIKDMVSHAALVASHIRL